MQLGDVIARFEDDAFVSETLFALDDLALTARIAAAAAEEDVSAGEFAAQAVGQADINTIREAGFDDGQILEINQVVAYFAYANRTVLGLGVDTDGDILGLSPNNSGNPDDWSHK